MMASSSTSRFSVGHHQVGIYASSGSVLNAGLTAPATSVVDGDAGDGGAANGDASASREGGRRVVGHGHAFERQLAQVGHHEAVLEGVDAVINGDRVATSLARPRWLAGGDGGGVFAVVGAGCRCEPVGLLVRRILNGVGGVGGGVQNAFEGVQAGHGGTV